jgi:hypothetical protein
MRSGLKNEQFEFGKTKGGFSNGSGEKQGALKRRHPIYER